jgi:hypothetical protein
MKVRRGRGWKEKKWRNGKREMRDRREGGIGMRSETKDFMCKGEKKD